MMHGRLGPYAASTPDDYVGTEFPALENHKNANSDAVKESLFTSFEDVKLTDEERVYLNAAALGDIAIVRQSIEDLDSPLNVNCVDYMGRSAIHLAVDCDNMDMVELLMERTMFDLVEEALLHAISKGATKLVKVIIEHPNYIAGAEHNKRTMKDPFFRTDEKSQFSPDVTPLILAAHHNNHEIIQMFLYRNHTIEKPHPIYCQCTDCVTKQNYDSLKRSRSRLHAYKALASPAYMALSNADPIMGTFQLRQEMKKLAQVEKEFKNEYLSLVEQCMNFACELMDLCRGTQEVEAVLSESSTDGYFPLERLKMAMEYEEKKFVAHPNCQQHLTSIWYGAEMGFMQSMAFWKQVLMWIVCAPLVPVLCIIYLVSPQNKISNIIRCPAAKFITHTVSNISFLILLTAATFRLDEKPHLIDSIPDVFLRSYPEGEESGARLEEDVERALKGTFRPANILITHVQICLIFWILGLLWMEYKQMYVTGLRVYLLDNYNLIDFSVLSLYVASYVLRFLVDHWIKETDQYFNGVQRAREALFTRNKTQYDIVLSEIFNDTRSYFMKASRFDWKSDDPEIVSDILFAIANVLSIARTTHLMPAFEVLGTLQISLGRMLADITRFMVLFTLVLFAFMVGLHNLYWYYGTQTYVQKDGSNKLVHTSEAFQGLPRTFYSLFWCMFGQINLESVEIKYPAKNNNRPPEIAGPTNGADKGSGDATSVIEGVGMFLFALYHVTIIIILINMLIAMMSHSFEAIQEDCDVEWKFARTRLWMNYINAGDTLPVPFNMLPAAKSFRHVYSALRSCLGRCKKKRKKKKKKNPGVDDEEEEEDDCKVESKVKHKQASFIESRRQKVCESLNIASPHTSNADMLQRLVRRYLFKLERMKEEGKDNAVVSNESNLITPGTMAETVLSTDDRSECNFAEESDGLMPVGPRSMPAKSRLNNPRLSTSGRAPPPKPQIQLLSLPQLDSIQRTLKILDVRLQHVQSNVRDDEKQTQDIDHIRRLMTENQSALTSVVTILSSIQDEVGSLRNLVTKQQANTFQIQPSSGSRHKSKSSGGGHSKQRDDKKQSSTSQSKA